MQQKAGTYSEKSSGGEQNGVELVSFSEDEYEDLSSSPNPAMC